jgi:GDPmannose 4,6-dehydratase
MRKILILGVTGQDGSYAADYFTQKNYKVYGVVRKSATNNFTNINHLIKNNLKNFQILKGDLLDTVSLHNIINQILPDEIYNYADQDHVGWSYQIPTYSMNTTALSVINILEILKYTKKKIKYFQPISSNIFGLTKDKKQNEKTLINPNSIYAIGKATALMACKMYSRNYGIFACGAIFFNHESPRRSEEYVTKKIVKQSVEIYKNKRKFISLGDIEAKIDWGYAKDYVEASSNIMSLKKPDFFIIASGKSFSVRFFLNECFSYLGLDYKKYIKINKKLLRPSKTSNLIGDTTKAYKAFGFKPKTKIKKLIEIMMKNELNNS